MNDCKTLLSFAPSTNIALVDSLRDSERGRLVVEALPPEGEQLARTESIRDVQFEQESIRTSTSTALSQLIPRQGCFVVSRSCVGTFTLRAGSLGGSPDRLPQRRCPAGTPASEALCPCIGFSQLVEVDLQREFVEVLHWDILEFVDEVLLDQQRFHLCSFFFPARLLQRKEAVANEPSKGDGAVVYGSAARSVSVLFSDLSFQRFACLKLC